MSIKHILPILLFLMFSLGSLPCQAQRLHPMNEKLVKQGFMEIPKYYPHIPRITADFAYALYLSNKALFVLISHSNHHLIAGGIHIKDGDASSIDPNKLPFKPKQVLVVY